jgi:hypothetical protein
MKGFKQCDQGHFYSDSLSECNYCPKNNSANKTLKGSNEEDNLDTIKTEHVENSDKTQVFGSGSSTKSTEDALDRTIIGRTNVGKDGDVKNEVASTNQKRKLRGWLVTFDIEDFGIDFKLFEGRNTIGSKSSNDITIQDNEVSSLHGLILFKKNKFILTDELSTNGTFLNGEELIPRNTYELNDGDEIKIGNTTLLFKMAIKI